MFLELWMLSVYIVHVYVKIENPAGSPGALGRAHHDTIRPMKPDEPETPFSVILRRQQA